MIETVKGSISPEQFGYALTHEHVMVDFAPASEVVPGRYDSEEVFNAVLPHLKQLKAAGGHSLVECTPNFLARDPALLRRLSESSGIHLVTNTGLYKEPHLPQFALEETEDELVERWVKEAEEGIDGTGIRPGFIKTAVPNETPFPPTNDKLIRVAARVHLRTGLPIVTHCTASEAMVEILQILEEESVPASAWIWAHADSVTNTRYHLKAARKGAWIEFDAVGRKPILFGQAVAGQIGLENGPQGLVEGQRRGVGGVVVIHALPRLVEKHRHLGQGLRLGLGRGDRQVLRHFIRCQIFPGHQGGPLKQFQDGLLVLVGDGLADQVELGLQP